MNIVCIVVCADITFILKRVTFQPRVAITKSKARTRSAAAEGAYERVSSYVSPTLTTWRRDADASSSSSSRGHHPREDRKAVNGGGLVDALLCRIQNDKDIETPLVGREMSTRAVDAAEKVSHSTDVREDGTVSL